MTEQRRVSLSTTIPGFRLVRSLGPPGLFEAEESSTREAVAVLLVDPSVAEDDGFAERLLREAELLRKVRHPHVAAIRALRGPQTDAPAFVVLEPLLGQTLEERLIHGPPLREAAAVRIAIQMLEGLAAVHRLGAVHHDLRPANLFLVPGPDGKPRVKLVGFGLGRPLAVAELADQVPDTAGLVLEPGYAPPEAFAEHPADVPGNVFGAGMILYRILADRLPFKAVDDEALWVERLCDRDASGEFRPPRDWTPTIPPMLSDAITLAIRRRPAERYPTAEAFCRRLLEVEASHAEGTESRPSMRLSARPASSLPAPPSAPLPEPTGPAARLSPASPAPRPEPAAPVSTTLTPAPSATRPGPAASLAPIRPSPGSTPPADPTLVPGSARRPESIPAPPPPDLAPHRPRPWIFLALGLVAASGAAFLLLRARSSGPSRDSPAPSPADADAASRASSVAPGPQEGPPNVPAGTAAGPDRGGGPPAMAVEPQQHDGATSHGPPADPDHPQDPPVVRAEPRTEPAIRPPFFPDSRPAPWPADDPGDRDPGVPGEPSGSVTAGANLPPTAPGMVRLQFSVHPPDAIVRVDRQTIGILHSIDLPRSERTLTVTVEPPNARFLPYKGYFVALRDRTITIRLERRDQGDAGSRPP